MMNSKPTDHLPLLLIVFLVAGAVAVLESCLTPALAQDQSQRQGAAIENLEELLGQYDQGDYHVPTKTSAELATALAVAQATITELRAQHALLLNEHETLKARCDGD
jgi:hypothetical protein